MLAAPASLTHQHIFATVNSLLQVKNSVIKILDAGCGDGRLIVFLSKALAVASPECKFEIYGFDVYDHGVQADGFLDRCTILLKDALPDIDWKQRISGVQIGEDWPYAENNFDFIVCNQVMEHVHDKPRFFQQVKKCLDDNGHFIALNPLKHYIYEGHIFLPWAHRFGSHTSLWRYISFCSFFGLGKFPAHSKETNISRRDYSERHADYIYFWTSYASESETLSMAKNAGLRASFSFSLQFYVLKVRQLLGMKYPVRYTYNPDNFFDSIAIKFLRYLSSVTLLCQKRNIY
jgi:SAM-dependent methyltransferase